MIFRKHAFDNYDSFFSSGQHQNNEIRESERLYKTKKKELLNYAKSMGINAKNSMTKKTIIELIDSA